MISKVANTGLGVLDLVKKIYHVLQKTCSLSDEWFKDSLYESW